MATDEDAQRFFDEIRAALEWIAKLSDNAASLGWDETSHYLDDAYESVLAARTAIMCEEAVKDG